jgi:hypothetical protein
MSKHTDVAKHRKTEAPVIMGPAGGPRAIAKGRKPLALVQKIAVTLIELARRHHGVLAEHRWGPDDTERLEHLRRQVVHLSAAQAAARLASLQDTKSLAELLDEVLVLRNRILAALRLVLRQTGASVESDMLRVAHQRRSVARVLAWLGKMRQTIAGLARPLSARLGFDVLEEIDRATAVLVDAFARQQASRRQLPAATADTQRASAALHGALGELQLAARIAFANERQVLRQFRLGLPRRRVAAGSPVGAAVLGAVTAPANDAPARVTEAA